jgi:site-specific recombinase XerC
MATEIVPVSTRSSRALNTHGIDVLEAFLAGRKANTMQAYHRDLNDFARFISPRSSPNAAVAVEALLANGHGPANAIVMRYRAHLTERRLAAATIARRLSALRAMVAIARQIGRVSWSLDVPGPKSEPYRDTRGPGLDGWRSLLRTATELATGPMGKRDLALLLLMHDHGLRRGEAVALDLADVELEKDQSVSILGKGKSDPIRLTLSSRPLAALRDWIDERGTEPGPFFTRLAVLTLKQPDRSRRELEGTQRTDERRQERGYPLAVTPDRLQACEAEIVEAERETAELWESLGLPMKGFESIWFERLAREAGLPERLIEMDRPCWR